MDGRVVAKKKKKKTCASGVSRTISPRPSHIRPPVRRKLRVHRGGQRGASQRRSIEPANGRFQFPRCVNDVAECQRREHRRQRRSRVHEPARCAGICGAMSIGIAHIGPMTISAKKNAAARLNHDNRQIVRHKDWQDAQERRHERQHDEPASRLPDVTGSPQNRVEPARRPGSHRPRQRRTRRTRRAPIDGDGDRAREGRDGSQFRYIHSVQP